MRNFIIRLKVWAFPISFCFLLKLDIHYFVLITVLILPRNNLFVSMSSLHLPVLVPKGLINFPDLLTEVFHQSSVVVRFPLGLIHVMIFVDTLALSLVYNALLCKGLL